MWAKFSKSVLIQPGYCLFLFARLLKLVTYLNEEVVLPLELLEGEFEVFFKDDTKVAIAFMTNVTSAILVLNSKEIYLGSVGIVFYNIPKARWRIQCKYT